MMIEITQLNVDIAAQDVIDGVDTSLPVSFRIGNVRYDVKANEDGSLDICQFSNPGGISVLPIASNMIKVKRA